MSPASVGALLPMSLLAAGALVALLLVTSVRARERMVSWTILTLAASLAATGLAAASGGARPVGDLMVVDTFASAFSALLLIAALMVTALSHGYWRRREPIRKEFYVFLLLATLGGMVLTASAHFASLFLGLELLSVSLYTMMGYARNRPEALEASVKYLVLTATASALLLFGMALLYAESGSLRFATTAAFDVTEDGTGVTLVGMAMLLAGVGFKLALVPFHMWTPDVYQGAPAPVTAFVATVSKASVLAALLRFLAIPGGEAGSVLTILALVAVLSVVVGNLLALFQTSLKRLLAYSSIAHFGYVLAAIVAHGALGLEAAGFYVVAYVVTVMGAFAVVIALSPGPSDRDALELYRGLFWRQPVLSAVLTGMLFSLAGIPLTAGFMGKVFVLTATVERAYWGLALALVIGSVLGVFYYLRVVVTMFRGRGSFPPTPIVAVPRATSLVLTALVVLLIWLGVQPQLVIQAIAISVGGLAPY